MTAPHFPSFTTAEWAIIVPAALSILGGSFAVVKYLLENRQSAEIVPGQFVGSITRPKSEIEFGARQPSDYEHDEAYMDVKVKNTGSKKFCVDTIRIIGPDKAEHGSFQKPDLWMEANEVKTFQVAIVEFEGPPLLEPPKGEGIIVVSTARKTYKSKPFKFSELPFEGPY